MRFACLRFSLALMVLMGLAACSKGGGNDPDPEPEEANLVVSTNPANGAVLPPALGPYSVTVNVSSVMPPNGVRIEVRARKDDGSGSPAFFSATPTSSAASNTINLTSVPANTLCLVEIKVTSLTKATNTWSGSYRFSSK